MEVFLLAEVPAVVAPEDDDRAVAGRTGVEGVEKPPNQGVGERDVGEVGLEDLGISALPPDDLQVSAPIRRHPLPAGRQVVDIASQDGWLHDRLRGVAIEVAAWGVPRQVRPIDTGGEKEGLGRRFPEHALRPGHEPAVTHFGVGHVERPPVKLPGVFGRVFQRRDLGKPIERKSLRPAKRCR